MRTEDHEKTAPVTLTYPAAAVPVFLLVACIALTRFTDEAAGGMSVVCVPLWLMWYLIFGVAARKRVAHFVRIYYLNRFFINARESSMRVLIQVLVCGGVCAALIALSAPYLSLALTGSVKGRLSLYALALSLPLLSGSGVLYGFLEGMGKRRSVLFADAFRAVACLAFTLPAGLFGYFRVGKPIDALLFTDDCGAAYAYLFVCLGLTAAELFLIFAAIVFRRWTLSKLQPLHETGKPYFLGDRPSFWRAILKWIIVLALPFVLLFALCILFHAPHPSALSAFCGHFLPVTTLTGLLLALPYFGTAASAFRKDADTEEKRGAGERFLQLIRRIVIFSMPAGCFLMALAEAVEGALFLVPNDNAILLMTIGGLLAPLMTLLLILTVILQSVRGKKVLTAVFGPAAVASALAGTLLLIVVHAGDPGLAVSALVFCLIADLLLVRYLTGIFQTRGVRILHMAAKPLGVSAACAIVLFLAARVLVHVIGEIPTCILCAAAGMLLYLVLLSVFRGVKPHDLEGVPFGALLERISAREKRS